MTYTAFDLHKKLTEAEGFDPQSDEYYSEIDKRIRLEFPHKFGNTNSNGRKYTTCSGTNSSFGEAKYQNWSQNCEAHTITGYYRQKIRCATRRVCETIKYHEGGISIWKIQ